MVNKLLLSDSLKSEFYTPKSYQRELRDLVRYKKKIIGQFASEKNRIIKILEDANIKLSSVLTNVDGATGTKIFADLIADRTDPKLLSKHYHGKIKASKKR